METVITIHSKCHASEGYEKDLQNKNNEHNNDEQKIVGQIGKNVNLK